MRQIAVVCLAAALASGWAGSSAAAQGTDFEVPSARLTEEQFLAPLLDPAGNAVRALTENLGGRRADLASARLLDNPEISATREDLGRGGVETVADVRWRPPRPDRRRLEVGGARERLAAAESALLLSHLELRLGLREIYARWAVAAFQLDLLQADLDLLRELTRRSQERSDVGEASGLEVRRLRLAETEAAAHVAVARSELATVLGQVRAWRPDLADAETNWVPMLPELPPVPESGPPLSPQIETLEAEWRAADMEARLAAKVAVMPEFVVGWKRVDPADSDAARSWEGLVFGLSWPVPLSGKGRVETQRSEAKRDVLAAQLELLRSRVGAERHSAEAAYRDLRAASALADEGLVNAIPAIAAARASFRLGESDLTTLLDTIRNVTSARLAALELHSQALVRQRDLERVRGEAFAETAEIDEPIHPTARRRTQP